MICYALFDPAQPLQVRYVGATIKTMKERLKGHFQVSADTRRAKWMRSVMARGGRVHIRALSYHTSTRDLACAEKDWAEFWFNYCDLLNDMRQLLFPPDDLQFDGNSCWGRKILAERIAWPNGGDMGIYETSVRKGQPFAQAICSGRR